MSELEKLIAEQGEREQQAREAAASARLEGAIAARQSDGDWPTKDEVIAEGQRNQRRAELRELGVQLD